MEKLKCTLFSDKNLIVFSKSISNFVSKLLIEKVMKIKILLTLFLMLSLGASSTSAEEKKVPIFPGKGTGKDW